MADDRFSRVVMHPSEQKRQARKHLAKAADRLCALLNKIISEIDAIDGDPDDEPMLGSVGAGGIHAFAWAGGATDDRELDASDDEYSGDEMEPSLGAVEDGSQLAWSHTPKEDLEESCDDEGFDSDTEPNGDELDCSQSEDDVPSHSHGLLAGRLTNPAEQSGIKYLDMDKDGNVSFVKGGVRWIGGRLLPTDD